MTAWSLSLGAILNLVGSVGAARRSALTTSGAVAAFIVGFLIYVGMGLAGWVLLMAFFLSSTALGRVRSDGKARAVLIHEKGSSRDAMQVLANGGVAAIASLFHLVTGETWAVLAFVASISAANADTWAGEIGMLSSRRPRSILTLQPVSTGQSGGVTLLGTAAAGLGAAFIGGVAVLLRVGGSWPSGSWEAIAVAGVVSAIAGFVGSFLDSLLGATVQARFLDPEGTLTEKSDPSHTFAGGIRWFTNDVVNIAAAFGAAVLGASLSPIVL